jgi:hypothetical protein
MALLMAKPQGYEMEVLCFISNQLFEHTATFFEVFEHIVARSSGR